MTPGQAQAEAELRRIAAVEPGAIIVDSITETGGSVVAVIGVDCRGLPHDDRGIRLRQREWFDVYVPSKFPFKPPTVFARHNRWAGTPHVQWKRYLCLYVAPAVEWNPADGMFGFLDRLVRWLTEASLGTLDPIGGPQHPPVVYGTANTPLFVVRADTPEVTGRCWPGMARYTSPTENRHDIIGWNPIREAVDADGTYAAAILLSEPLPFEFPKNLGDLIGELERARIEKDVLYFLLGVVARRLDDDEPLYVVIGTPMRATVDGEPRQHLAVWRLPAVAASALATLLSKHLAEEASAALVKLEDLIDKWAAGSSVEWCTVREARPEVTQDRSGLSPMRVFEGKTVSLWGCGAIGSHVAELLVRAGAKRLLLRDRAVVAPGVLVRQRFDDADIGDPKAAALKRQLDKLRPDVNIDAFTSDVLTDPAIEADWSDGADVVIDATANNSVAQYLELLRSQAPEAAHVMSIVFGHTAEHAFMMFCPVGGPGGPADVARQGKLAALRGRAPTLYADEFWPDPPRSSYFQPEPGCSEPTFTGSATDVAALVARLVRQAAAELDAGTEMPVVLFTNLNGDDAGSAARIVFGHDLVLRDPFEDYKVRVSPSAVAEMRAWVRRSERLAPGHESGGVLFGERDDALRVFWVTDVLGPPPDSQASPLGFVCGVEGVDDAAEFFLRRSRGSSRPIGMWHTHPGGPPRPSPTDRGGMRQLVDDQDRPLPTQLLLIVGGDANSHDVAAYTYEAGKKPPTFFPMFAAAFPPAARPPHKIGLSLSGGGFRAVAFHLGVLRGLHDRGVLEHVDVMSSVSGGSIITAMWAYSDDSFDEFDARVVDLLERGLTWRILCAAGLSRRVPQAAVSSALAAAGSIWAVASGLARRGLRLGRRGSGEPPFRRAVTLTRALEDVFSARLFGSTTVAEPKRPLATVINAAELRSGNAFRFGSVETGSSRFGRLLGPPPTVARAVAASAAYPVAFPAIDDVLTFVGFDGVERRERVLLTDGGVYDNLGVTALQHGRNPKYSTNVHPVDYVVSADAGYGVLDTDKWPLWWPTRMKRSFESVYRKVQDAGKGLLHEHRSSGKIKGFALPFLGMNDRALPHRPPDLVPRDAVARYPTNFTAMTDDNLDLLTLRGEQLVRLVIEAYCPDIA